jgi:hypothetical protein
LFTLAYLLQGATRAGYSAWRHPVSALALGQGGWMQLANFLVSGGLLAGFAVGVRRARHASVWSPRLIGAAGLGLIGAGVFACDPIGGYPPGTPLRSEKPSRRGSLHVLFSALVFLGLPVLFGLEARRGEPTWRPYSAATCAAFVSTFALSSAGFAEASRLAKVGGLFQRLSLSSGFLWLTLRAARALREMSD